MLDGHCRVIGVRNQSPGCARSLAQGDEDVPVPGTGTEQVTGGSPPQLVDERQRPIEGRGPSEESRFVTTRMNAS